MLPPTLQALSKAVSTVMNLPAQGDRALPQSLLAWYFCTIELMGVLPQPRLPHASRRGLLLSAPLLALPHVPRRAAAASAPPILDEPMQRLVGDAPRLLPCDAPPLGRAGLAPESRPLRRLELLVHFLCCIGAEPCTHSVCLPRLPTCQAAAAQGDSGPRLRAAAAEVGRQGAL